MTPLADVLRRTRGLSRSEFEAFCAAPGLVFAPYSESGDTNFQTLAEGGGGPTGLAKLAFVAKRPEANAFSAMITLGRAPNNDLVLNADSVSKFHGYFILSGDQTDWVDANSANGSLLNGRRLTPKERTSLSSGDQLQLGELCATFYSRAGLLDFLLGT